jgi:hypothetical protein
MVMALVAGCGLLADLDQEYLEPKQPAPDQEGAEEKPAEPPEPAQDPIPPIKYTPPDFPAPQSNLGGGFYKGNPMPGLDPYRAPNATSPYAGYYYYFGPHDFHRPVIKVEREIKKVEEEKKGEEGKK